MPWIRASTEKVFLMQPICQSYLPYKPWMQQETRRLPGLAPKEPEEWICRDEVFGQQMAYRDQLIKTKRDIVYQIKPEANESARELLAVLIDELSRQENYQYTGRLMVRPDGVEIDLINNDPLIIAGCLVQEDLNILHSNGDTHYLCGGIMCFPASWNLKEKMGRGLSGIHTPVKNYDHSLSLRIERIFSQVRDDYCLVRANFFLYSDPDLHQPRVESEKKYINPYKDHYIRVERQSLRRLSKTKAIIFAIHTYVLPVALLSQDERDCLYEHCKADFSDK